jgi:hypothetical protein
MLPIGVIGAGTEWEAVWRPALSGQSRLHVVSFYDPIARRGERVAEDLDWKLAANVGRLLETPQLRGVIVLDPGWHGTWAAEQAEARRIPVFVSPRTTGLETLAVAFPRVSGESLIQPEMRRRYTAATMRLRELTATRLGPVESLEVEIPSPFPLTVSQIAEAADWCRFVVQSAVTSLETDADRKSFQVLFRKTIDGRLLTGRIHRTAVKDRLPPEYPADFSAKLICRNGTVSVTGNRLVRWQAGEEAGDEELSDDRTSAAVQLDLFSRRLVGGLVPVVSLEEVATVVDLARHALQ